MENSETRAARGEAVHLLAEANSAGNIDLMRKTLQLIGSLLPPAPAPEQPGTNGYCFVSAENDSASVVTIKHPTYGRQLWQRSYLSEPDVCTVTGHELLAGWLAYYPPVDARNSGEVIGEAGIRRLLKCG
jgi:hypothetical protein